MQPCWSPSSPERHREALGDVASPKKLCMNIGKFSKGLHVVDYSFIMEECLSIGCAGKASPRGFALSAQSLLLMLEILHDLVYQNCKNSGSITYWGMQDLYRQQYVTQRR